MEPTIESIDVDRDRRPNSIHPWWSQRWPSDARAAIELVLADLRGLEPDDEITILDLASGTGAIAEAAADLGFDATAIDNSPIATLIARCRLEYARDDMLIEPGDDWFGLEAELTEAIEEITTEVRHGAGSLWHEDTRGTLMARATACQSCDKVTPSHTTLKLGRTHVATWDQDTGSFTITERTDFQNETPVTRQASCGFCGGEIRAAADVPSSLIPVATFAGDRRQMAWLPPSELDQAQTEDTPFLWDTGKAFTKHRGRALSWEVMTSSRQRVLLALFTRTTGHYLTSAGHRWTDPYRSEAISAYLGLFVSGLLRYLTVGTRIAAGGGIAASTDRPSWHASSTHVEIDGIFFGEYARRWLRAVHELITPDRRPVSVVHGDMRHIPFPTDIFSAVIWDPPYYDNIDYASVTAPFEQILRATVTDHPDLVRSTAIDASTTGSEFVLDDYVEGIRQGAAEAVRVLRPGGRIAIWWSSKAPQESAQLSQSSNRQEPSSEELGELIDTLQQDGLVMLRAIWLRQVGAHFVSTERHRQYLLIFEPSGGSPAPDVDSGTVMALADDGRPSLYEGLADLLSAELTSAEVESMVPGDFRGSPEQQLLEYVAGITDPEGLLLEIVDRSRLVDLAGIVNPSIVDEPRDRLANARVILRSLGWSIPEPAGFSIEKGVDDLDRARARSQLSTSEQDLREVTIDASRIVESILKLSVKSWRHLASTRGYTNSIDPLPQSPSLGDWQHAFITIPKTISSSIEESQAVFGRIAHGQKKARTTQVLDAFTSLRNAAHHPGDRPKPSADEVRAAISDALTLFRRLTDELFLPVVLEPQQERRERYGRLTLIAEDGKGRTREIYVSDSVDLTRPLIWIPMATNPRNVDPPLLDAFEVLG